MKKPGTNSPLVVVLEYLGIVLLFLTLLVWQSMFDSAYLASQSGNYL